MPACTQRFKNQDELRSLLAKPLAVPLHLDFFLALRATADTVIKKKRKKDERGVEKQRRGLAAGVFKKF